MWLFVGLGNPGPPYAGNRHNVGFMAIDAIARRWHAPLWRQKFCSEIAAVTLDGERVLLLKPLTFMNESGRAVAEAMGFYKLLPKQLVVFHDELDLPLGKVRVKLGGGTAGHNGLKSLAACLGSADFLRVRIGIGHPGDKQRVVSWVLSDFTADERQWLEPMLAAIAELAPLLLRGEWSKFTNGIIMHLRRSAQDRAGQPA